MTAHDTVQDQYDEQADIRDAVAKLCAQFPGEYWRKLDREMAYPSDFVNALTEAGYLSVLIPEEYGGAGLKLSAATAILEEIHRAGCAIRKVSEALERLPSSATQLKVLSWRKSILANLGMRRHRL